MQSNLLYVVQSNRVEFNCSGSCSFYVESKEKKNKKSLWLSSESRMTPSGQTTSFKTEALNTVSSLPTHPHIRAN